MSEYARSGSEEYEESRYGRASMAVVLIAVMLAFLLACPCGIGAIMAVRHFVSTAEMEYDAWVDTSGRVTWSGEGGYGVLQTSTADGVPVVVAWDRTTGDTGEIAGYRLAAVERYGAIAWLVPLGTSDLSEHPDGEWESILVPPGGPFDAASGSLFAWDLESHALTPVPPGTAPQWSRWPGPAEWSATAVIDPETGIHPGAVLIGHAEAGVADRMADLPSDLRSFDVTGWSPSGRYLALAELLDAAEFSAAGRSGWPWPFRGGDPKVGVLERRILMIDARTGAIAAQALQSVSHEYAGSPVWHLTRDMLLWVDQLGDDTDTDGLPGIRAMVPGEVALDASDALGQVAPEEWAGAERVHVPGGGHEGFLAEVVGADVATMWWLADSGVRKAGFPVSGTGLSVYHPDAGLLVLEKEREEGSMRARDTLVNFAREEDTGEVVWTGEWRTEGW